jgi:hypothetical protein
VGQTLYNFRVKFSLRKTWRKKYGSVFVPQISAKNMITHLREFPKLTTISRKQKIQDSNQTIIIDANASEISKS